MPDSNVVLYPGELLLPADRSSLTEWPGVAVTSSPPSQHTGRMCAGLSATILPRWI